MSLARVAAAGHGRLERDCAGDLGADGQRPADAHLPARRRRWAHRRDRRAVLVLMRPAAGGAAILMRIIMHINFHP